jgi:hypothetical protein
MAKIRHIWQQFRQKIKLPGWLTIQVVIVGLVALLFIAMMIWNEPIVSLFIKPTSTPLVITIVPTVQPGTPTPLPEEWVESSQQTNGIIFGGSIMILIIVISVVSLMLRNRNPSSAYDRRSLKSKEKKRRMKK